MKGRKVVGKVGVKCRIRRVLYSIRVRSEQKRKLFLKKDLHPHPADNWPTSS